MKANVNKQTHAKGNDVLTVISTNHHFASICSIQIFKSQQFIVVAHSPSFSFPSARVTWRACWHAITPFKTKQRPNFIDSDSNTFLQELLITLLHLILKACFMSLLEAGVRGFSACPSFNFFGFGSFVSLAIIEKSESECNREYWATKDKHR